MHSLNQRKNADAGRSSAPEKSLYDNVSEERVIRQLAEALLYEGILPFTFSKGVFRFQAGGKTYSARGKISGFERIRLQRNSILLHTATSSKKPDLINLVSSLPSTRAIKEKLLSELTQTITFCEWNKNNLPRFNSRLSLSYPELESAIIEGHPYHPCFKARSGFSMGDHEKFGPEGGNTFQLHWLAVQKSFIKVQLPLAHTQTDENQFWQSELEDSTWLSLQARLAEQGGASKDYSLLPIHPWQWKNLEERLSEGLKSKHLLYLGKAGDFYQATISVRTLINISRPHKANIKLPMNMVNSSALRTLEAPSVCAAPYLSQWLEIIVSNDSFFKQIQPLGLLPEYAGFIVQDAEYLNTQGNAAPSWTNNLSGQIGVIFRESLEAYCKRKSNNHQGMPFVGLALLEPNGQPLIQPWLERYGCEAWLEKLIGVTLSPIWHLLIHHGIALEAHAQNMILLHREGWPQEIVLRDFHESLEYVEDFLAEPDAAPKFKELDEAYRKGEIDQYYWMSSVEALRELLVDTLFVFNLGDLAVLMAEHYQYSEERFWRLVHMQLEKYLQADYSSEQRIARINLYSRKIKTESLMEKKLSGETHTEFHHEVNNPLYSILQRDRNK